MLNSEALHEVDNLKVHISRGCLSGLPPGCGTNLNEAFHSNIRVFFNRSRIGILLAYALLSVIIANHNSHIPKTIVRAISCQSSEAERISKSTEDISNGHHQ